MIDYPYIVLCVVLTALGFASLWAPRASFFTACACAILFLGLRSYDVGADTRDYVEYFSGSKSYYNLDERELEPLLDVYNAALSVFSRNGTFYLLVSSLLSLGSFFLLAKKYSTYPTFSVLFFFLIGSYLNYFVALRQVLALSLNILAMILVLENARYKWLMYLCLGVVATMLHSFSAITAVLYALAYLIPITRRRVYLLAVCISAGLGIFSSSYSYSDLFSMISGVDVPVIGRILVYLEGGGVFVQPLNITLRLSIFMLFASMLASRNALNEWVMKISLIGVVLYNLLNALPMVVRIHFPYTMLLTVAMTLPWERSCAGVPVGKIRNLLGVILFVYMLRSFIVSNINPVDLANDKTKMHPYVFVYD